MPGVFFPGDADALEMDGLTGPIYFSVGEEYGFCSARRVNKTDVNLLCYSCGLTCSIPQHKCIFLELIQSYIDAPSNDEKVNPSRFL